MQKGKGLNQPSTERKTNDGDDYGEDGGRGMRGKYDNEHELRNKNMQMRKPGGHGHESLSPRREIARLKHHQPPMGNPSKTNVSPGDGRGRAIGRTKPSPERKEQSPLRAAHAKNIHMTSQIEQLSTENSRYRVTLAAWKLRYYVEYLRLSGTNRYNEDLEAELEYVNM